ncbi:hypothetical protein HS967_11960 [Enterobacter hormaechei]|uniref:hypothetical protein n=1 Tax=Enterobacter hormaechei TaxID=158836 RepID=UPI0015FC8ED5|nr:hypothetical protein [Enterobacter hormaechei]QMV75921.1 hypothetical protein HS967_11960 [Enterobacter hormaechei]
MKLFEMEGFLRGKCLPGDMKVNETNAEYLVRKFAEAESKCAALAAENAYLIPKAASELSNAWVLHKYLIGIQAAIMYLDNGNKKAAQEWLYGTIAGPGFEFPDEVDDIDAWAKHQMRGSISHPQALEIIKAETPETETFLAEVRAQAKADGVQEYADSFRHSASKIRECHGDTIRVRALLHEANNADEFAAQLRQGGVAQ